MSSASSTLKRLFLRPNKCMKLVFPMNVFHACLLEELGYETFYVGGGTVLGPMMGRLDNGTITMTESVQVSKWFADAVSIPVITDADSCFGGIFQVQRAVREYIQAGVAGINIEDQPFIGKRMGALAGKEVIPVGEAVAKYRVAADVRDKLDPDFQIIARCDALTASNARGVPEVISRLLAYKEAGADVLYFEGPRSLEEIREVREAIPGPLFCTAYNLPREITDEEGAQLGLSAVAYLQANRSQIRFLYYFYKELQEKGYGAIEEFNAKCPIEIDVLRSIRRKYILGDIESFERKYLGGHVEAKYAEDATLAALSDGF